MVRPEVRTEGYRQAQEVIDKAQRAQADLRPAYRAVLEQFEDEQEQVFAHSGAHGGRPRWTRLSEAYAAFKQRHYGDLPILTLSSSFAETLTDSNATGAIREVTRDVLVIGSVRAVGSKSKGYNLGVLHAEGKGNLPKREAIRPTAEQDEKWADLIMGHLFVEE